jgi:D-alanyl-D-alanine carboxypeptidase (penicillin-binding protein 5/6)
VGRRSLSIGVGLGLLLASVCQAAQPLAQDPFDGVAQAYRVDIDGERVWHKNADQRLAPASLTKLMTALLLMEQLQPDATVVVDAAAAHETGSRLGLRAGERWPAGELLAATLIASANDACRALADHAAGEQARFVQRMNQHAHRLGLHHTHFANACGHDAPDHYSSANDLAVLALAVMQQPRLAALVGLAELSIASADGKRRFTLANKNALIGRYVGAVGIKTGTTPQAGTCLVALARRGPHTVLLVLLKGKDRWWDAVDMLDIAFARATIPQ